MYHTLLLLIWVHTRYYIFSYRCTEKYIIKWMSVEMC